jgi:hypothetical protein
MKTFREFMLEQEEHQGGVEAKAGVAFGLGKAQKAYRFKVSELIQHAKDKKIKDLEVGSLANRTLGNREGESKESEKKRVQNADTSYPIIATRHPVHGHVVLDGTHRLQKARDRGDTHIKTHIVPWREMKRYRVKE